MKGRFPEQSDSFRSLQSERLNNDAKESGMMDKQRFQNPAMSDRPYRLVHDTGGGAGMLDSQIRAGFGGIVTNAAWHTAQGDPEFYLHGENDFGRLDEVIRMAAERGMGLWLYDEKGYPSGSADGLTMLGHPEFEARGFTEIRAGGEGSVWVRPDIFEKILFACRDDGTPVPFDAFHAEGADRVYAIRPVFEGSHAQNCGWGPRHYPNLLDKAAVSSFIRCTYDRYYENTKEFGRFEAVFTDEPSLMSGFVNCGVPMPYVFLPWAEDMPAVYRKMHGRELTEDLPVLFSRADKFEEGKLRYWQTVAEMMNEAFFGQINRWCEEHGIPFSGHCLLEEGLAMHVPLYGNLVKQLKTFGFPGVDMLTGDPEAYKKSPADFAMACRYVGGAARMTGKTERVMVEICPIQGGRKEDFSFAEERGIMDLIFRAGINHINSYLAPERLGEDFPHYAAIFARAAYMLRGAAWKGRIGIYYPIETAQGFYCPESVGVNSGAPLSEAEKLAEATLRKMNLAVAEGGLDYTLVDADWILEAQLRGSSLSSNGLEIDALILPAVRWLDPAVRDKLAEFEKEGGLLLWTGAIPDGTAEPLSEDPVGCLRERVSYGLSQTASDPASLFVSLYEKEGRRMWYLVNSSPEENEVGIDPGTPVEIWHTFTGAVTEEKTFVMPPYTSVFVTEK